MAEDKIHCTAGLLSSSVGVIVEASGRFYGILRLVEHKHMTPDAAYEYVRFIRLLLREFQASGFEAI